MFHQIFALVALTLAAPAPSPNPNPVAAPNPAPEGGNSGPDSWQFWGTNRWPRGGGGRGRW